MLMGPERLGRSLGSYPLRTPTLAKASLPMPTCAVLVPFHAATVTCPSNTQYLPFTGLPATWIAVSFPLFSAHWRSSPARGFCQFIGIHSAAVSWFRLVHNRIRSELCTLHKRQARHSIARYSILRCATAASQACSPGEIRTQRSNPSRCALRIARNERAISFGILCMAAAFAAHRCHQRADRSQRPWIYANCYC